MPGTSGRVLVVDDSKAIRQLIRVNLELEGFEVVTASDGAECLEIVHSVRPDVVTLDLAMPRLDGMLTAHRLRGDPRTRHIPVAVISAGSPPGSAAAHAEEAGARAWHGVDAFLPKPFEPADLILLVRCMMRGGGDGAEPADGCGGGRVRPVG